MNRQPNQPRSQQRTIVDLKARKRRTTDDCVINTVDQPQEKVPALLQSSPNYREGTPEDIQELLKAEPPLKDDGVFLKGKSLNPSEDRIEEYLGHGGFSKRVLLYKSSKSDMSYVCKEIEANKFNDNEVIHMCQLNDVYICQIYGLVRKATEYHIYMEYCGINLYELTKTFTFTLDQIVEITKKLCIAVEFAHNKNILHLDIKPENICLLFTMNGIKLKLTDWGSSRQDSSSTGTLNITLWYSSPEVLYLYISQAMCKLKDESVVEKAIQLTKKFSQNYNNIETVSTNADSFSIGMTIMFIKIKKHIYEEPHKCFHFFDLFQMFAENPDTAKVLLPVSNDFVTYIAKKLVEGDSHKRSSVKDVQIMINEYQQTNHGGSSEIIEEISEPVPEDQQYNIPNFDMLLDD